MGNHSGFIRYMAIGLSIHMDDYDVKSSWTRTRSRLGAIANIHAQVFAPSTPQSDH